jgi:hypothetical protein
MDQLEEIKEDFRKFLYVIWLHLGLPSPTGIQYALAHYLQYGKKRRMVQAFRGVGKSWITAAYVLWRLFINPEERILVVSASKDRADAFSVFLKRLISEVPILHHLQPNPDLGHRDSNIAFDVGPSSAHQAPSVRSVGITGQLTGGRATIIIADDVEVPKNSLTQTMRDKLSESVKEFDAVVVPGGEIIYLGTPQTEMSLYNVLPQRGYDIRVWPAKYVSHKDAVKYGGKLATEVISDTLAGNPTEPIRFTELDLAEREASYGRSGFSLQFMLDTSLSDANRYPLRLSDLIVMDLDKDKAPVKVVWAGDRSTAVEELESVGFTGDRWHKPMYVSPEWAEYQGSMMFIDPSGRGKDETGYAVVNMMNGMLFLMDCGGFTDGYSSSVLTSLAEKAKEWRVKYIDVEDNFGDGMFKELFKPYLTRLYPCTINEEPSRVSTQKERRIIDTLEPVMNQHRLVVNAALVRKDITNYNQHPGDTWSKYQLFHQMTRITKDRGSLLHDDRLDSLASAVAYWTRELDRDQEQTERDHREKLMDQELENFMEHVLGGARHGEAWVEH